MKSYIIPKLKAQRSQLIGRFTIFRMGSAKNVKWIKKINYCDDKKLYLNICMPNECDGVLPVFVYLHGGGFVSGNPECRVSFVSNIAARGYFTVNIFYGYAPEYAHPFAVENIYKALAYIVSKKDEYRIDINRIFVCGESAGAYLSAVLGAISTNEDYKSSFNLPNESKDLKLFGLVLNCGIYNIATTLKSGFKNIESYIYAYFNKGNDDHKYFYDISPINFITKDFPKTLIISAENDKLNLESFMLEEVLNEHDVENTHFFAKGIEAVHGFVVVQALKPSKQAMEKIFNFLKKA